jgi:S-adenosylmethionine:tRNA ribosyltransferase-isomerase
MHPKELKIEDYSYELPADRIAKYPLQVRDASKLLIYKEGEISQDIYHNLAEHIPTGSLLVFNQTKVVHARLLFKKTTGGTIEIFCLEPEGPYPDVQTAMHQKRTVLWQCMIGGASKWRHGMVLEMKHPDPGFTLSAKIVARQTSSYVVELSWDNDLSFAEILHFAGKVPLPPYLHREAEATDEERYQTIFAKEEGSVAAPTAGLHFTEDVLESIQNKKIDLSFVTLHVGAGTFLPVKSVTMAGHEMHAEWIEVSKDTIKQLMTHLENDIIAVGTTSARTLESLYWIGNKLLNKIPIDFHEVAITQWEPYETSVLHKPNDALQALSDWMQKNKQKCIITRTQILIAPGYDFKIIKALVTNFHQPKSTLLLFIAALLGENWRGVYDYALHHQFRFLSYGDGCLLWK